MLHYINARNKSAAAQLLNLPTEAIAEVVEYANSYYVKVKKGFGKSGKFVSKASLIRARDNFNDTNLIYWMQDFVNRKAPRIEIGTMQNGLHKSFGCVNYTNLELALYEYRQGLKIKAEYDAVVIGWWDSNGYHAVDSFVPQFEVV